MKRSVTQDWVNNLPLMMQSVLLSSVRGPDGFDKDSSTKPICRWYRRSILISAFEGVAINDPHQLGGGSFTGALDKDISTDDMMDNYFSKMDSIPLHFYTHFMHAAEITGYKHPNDTVRLFWNKFYKNCVNKLHLVIETEEMMDARLGDTEAGWKARETIPT